MLLLICVFSGNSYLDNMAWDLWSSPFDQGFVNLLSLVIDLMDHYSVLCRMVYWVA